jgi:rSAM/selenodomain-associated transferase 2
MLRVKPLVSIIVPAWNEAETLRHALEAIAKNATPHEVIVVDGGSSDGTVGIAQRGGVRLVSAAAGNRAIQMNEGRRLAQGDVLLFLHADTLISRVALDRIVNALRRPRVVGGAFARRYASRSAFLRATCLLAEVRGRLFGWFLGDQAIFARTEVFDALGGFREWDLFEDLDFARRLKRVGRVTMLRPPVVTSARRFSRRGPIRTTFSDFVLTCRYAAGLRIASVGEPAGKRAPSAT